MRPVSSSSSSNGSSGRGLVDRPRDGEPLRAEDEAMRLSGRASEEAAVDTLLCHPIANERGGG
jgi:hypothetical protein